MELDLKLRAYTASITYKINLYQEDGLSEEDIEACVSTAYFAASIGDVKGRIWKSIWDGGAIYDIDGTVIPSDAVVIATYEVVTTDWSYARA